MKDLRAIKGRYYIDGLIRQGEHDTQDFKFAISDARKIARSISAFANTRGGRLLIGVKDNGIAAGIRTEEDLFVVEDAAERHCVPPQHVTFTAFSCGEGVTVVRAEIQAAEQRPVCVREADGTLHPYYRVADENISAHPLMAEAWSSNAGTATMGDAERRAVDALRDSSLAPDKLAIAAGLSYESASRAIVNLLRLEVARFVFSHNQWLLQLSE